MRRLFCVALMHFAQILSLGTYLYLVPFHLYTAWLLWHISGPVEGVVGLFLPCLAEVFCASASCRQLGFPNSYLLGLAALPASLAVLWMCARLMLLLAPPEPSVP